jgi:hypothetical protein
MVKRLKRIIAEYVDTSQFPINATVREDGVVILEGEAPDWKTADELAHRVAKSKKVRNVINHLSCDGKSLAYIPKIEPNSHDSIDKEHGHSSLYQFFPLFSKSLSFFYGRPSKISALSYIVFSHSHCSIRDFLNRLYHQFSTYGFCFLHNLEH